MKDQEFLPKLEKIETLFMASSENLKILLDKYSQTMKTLNLFFYDMTEEELKTCIECISRFENLKELALTLSVTDITEPMYSNLSLIGKKCTKILTLILINNSVPISDRTFDIFTEFKTIKILYVLSNVTLKKGSIESLKYCKQLKTLDIINTELTEDFFANIASFVPTLHLLSIKTDKQFSDSFINSFQSMKSINEVDLTVENKDNKTIDTMNWYFGERLSQVMLSPDGINVIRVNDNCGLVQTLKSIET